MLCILGYAANASAIEIHPGHHAGEGAAEASHHLVNFGKTLLARAAEAAHGAAAEGHGEAEPVMTAQNTAVHAAAAFFLIIKLTRGE